MSDHPPKKATAGERRFQIEIAKIHEIAKRRSDWLGFFLTFARISAFPLSIYLIFEGLNPIMERDAPAIQAFAKIVTALKLDHIASWLIAGISAVGWALERGGKKRALREKAALQHQIEAGDPYRSSSHNPI